MEFNRERESSTSGELAELRKEVQRLNEQYRRLVFSTPTLSTRWGNDVRLPWNCLATSARISDPFVEAFLKEFSLNPEYFRARRVLDVGCGGGRFTEVFLRLEAYVHAVDNDEQALSSLRAISDIKRPQLRVENRDILQWAEPAEYDLVFSHGLLNFSDNPYRALENMASKVRCGGRIVLAVQSYAGSRIIGSEQLLYTDPMAFFPGPQKFSRTELLPLLDRLGFSEARAFSNLIITAIRSK